MYPLSEVFQKNIATPKADESNLLNKIHSCASRNHEKQLNLDKTTAKNYRELCNRIELVKSGKPDDAASYNDTKSLLKSIENSLSTATNYSEVIWQSLYPFLDLRCIMG